MIDWGAAMVARLPRDALLDSPGPVTLFSCNASFLTWVLNVRPFTLHPTHLTLSIAADCPGDSPYFEICSVSFKFHSSSFAVSRYTVADMAPSSKPAAPPYTKDEKVLCFHHDMLYEAKIIEIDSTEEGGFRYKIHYKGWKATWDDWVPQDRIRKLNDENRELAAQLNQQARASMQKKSGPAKKAGLKNGSDFSSARGSEERSGAAATMSGRGRKRDFDLENVSTQPGFLLCPAHFIMCPIVSPAWILSMGCKWSVPPECRWKTAGVKLFEPKGPSRITREFLAKFTRGCLGKPKARLCGNFYSCTGSQ